MPNYFHIASFIIMIVRLAVYAMQQEKIVATNDAMEDIDAKDVNNFYKPVKRRYKMRCFFPRKIKTADPLFNGHFVDAKTLYVLQFDKVPCVCFIGEIDVANAHDYIGEKLRWEVVNVFQHAYFDHDRQQTFFNNTVYILTENRMIELARGYVQILHTPKDYAWADEMMKALAVFRMEAPAYQTQVVGFARQSEMN